MVKEKKHSKFKVGDRVIGVAGLRGTVTRLGQGKHVVFVLWDYGNSQELTWVSGLIKLIGEGAVKLNERANRDE